jgi:hypothetical protein
MPCIGAVLVGCPMSRADPILFPHSFFPQKTHYLSAIHLQYQSLSSVRSELKTLHSPPFGAHFQLLKLQSDKISPGFSWQK